MAEKIKAVGLVSGGLDSALAVAVLRRLGIDLLGLHYYNGFSPGSLRSEVYGTEKPESRFTRKALELSEVLGIPVEVIDVSVEFLHMLVSPQHGYGANVNPCIDCRIFMLRKAKERMEREDAGFVFTGEVLGQRPMSQHRRALELVERQSGLQGLLLRPLSAKLLPQTIPERKGWVNRNELLDIQGRSRKRQIALAGELGIKGYSQPAGGCTLTDENYARKFKDLLEHRDPKSLTRDDTLLLAVGRHFRLSPLVKIVVGRDEEENTYIELHVGEGWIAVPMDVPGPTVLIQGETGTEEIRTSAAIAARFSDAKYHQHVRVLVKKGEREEILEVTPAEDDLVNRLRI